MTELAGWVGAVQLPPRIARELAAEEARELREAKRAEEAREVAAEAWQARNLTLAREMAQARGEELGVLELAAGRACGRPISAVFADALRAADAQDARDTARLRREGNSPPVHIEVGEPVLHYSRGDVGLTLSRRARQFWRRVQARKALEAAENAALNDRALPRAALVRDQGGGVVYTGPSRRSDEEELRLAYRNNGHVVGWQ
jgi:hypothetical protein